MQTLDCITSRRAHRLFLSDEISNDILEKIMKSAVSAPSAQNKQPWHFILVKDAAKKTSLANLKEENNRDHILSAPIVIIVCIDTALSPNRAVEDGALASENILLVVHDMGLASVYLTAYKPDDDSLKDSIQELFSMPKNIFPVSILPIGYPDKSEEILPKSLPALEKITHTDMW